MPIDSDGSQYKDKYKDKDKDEYEYKDKDESEYKDKYNPLRFAEKTLSPIHDETERGDTYFRKNHGDFMLYREHG